VSRSDPLAVRYRRTLKASVSAEARAYGFSVAILITGYLAISEHGLPGWAGSLAYLGGILLAQIGIGVLGMQGESWDTSEPYRYASFGALRVVCVAAAVLAGWGVAALVSGHVLAFFLSALVSVGLFQLLMALELALSVTSEADGNP
jgi:hypothetical protein